MDVTFSSQGFEGKLDAQPSKSDAHRKLIAAALSKNASHIALSEASNDIRATMCCLSALGANFAQTEDGYDITPAPPAPRALLNCGESGSTLRFLLPVAAALGVEAEFTGVGRLPSRPIGELIELLEAHGCKAGGHTLPLTLSGKLEAGDYALPGGVSSQYITGLMLALPLLEGQSRITLTSPLESADYVGLTIDVLKGFGVSVLKAPEGYIIPGDQSYSAPKAIRVEGDWSNAAFPLVMGALAGDVTVAGLSPISAQGDKAIVDILRQMGANVCVNGDSVRARRAALTAIELDVSRVPDMAPVLSIAAACARGKSIFYNAGRLKLKESDRLTGCRDMINALGGRARSDDTSLTVYGTGLTGGEFDGCGDHRMVMAAAVCAAFADVKVTGAEAVDKSYPGFLEDFIRLGGRAERF